jgi:hypothetical protein
LGINLETAQINTAIAKQLLKAVTDGISTQPTNEGNRSAKSGQRTGHVGGGPSETINTISRISGGGITSERSEPIHKSLTEAKHLRSGIGHQTFGSYQQTGQRSS